MRYSFKHENMSDMIKNKSRLLRNTKIGPNIRTFPHSQSELGFLKKKEGQENIVNMDEFDFYNSKGDGNCFFHSIINSLKLSEYESNFKKFFEICSIKFGEYEPHEIIRKISIYVIYCNLFGITIDYENACYHNNDDNLSEDVSHENISTNDYMSMIKVNDMTSLIKKSLDNKIEKKQYINWKCKFTPMILERILIANGYAKYDTEELFRLNSFIPNDLCNFLYNYLVKSNKNGCYVHLMIMKPVIESIFNVNIKSIYVENTIPLWIATNQNSASSIFKYEYQRETEINIYIVSYCDYEHFDSVVKKSSKKMFQDNDYKYNNTLMMEDKLVPINKSSNIQISSQNQKNNHYQNHYGESLLFGDQHSNVNIKSSGQSSLKKGADIVYDNDISMESINNLLDQVNENGILIKSIISPSFTNSAKTKLTSFDTLKYNLLQNVNDINNKLLPETIPVYCSQMIGIKSIQIGSVGKFVNFVNVFKKDDDNRKRMGRNLSRTNFGSNRIIDKCSYYVLPHSMFEIDVFDNNPKNANQWNIFHICPENITDTEKLMIDYDYDWYFKSELRIFDYAYTDNIYHTTTNTNNNNNKTFKEISLKLKNKLSKTCWNISLKEDMDHLIVLEVNQTGKTIDTNYRDTILNNIINQVLDL